METKDLLKPRYKVIADYPENTLEVGQILIESDVFDDWLQTDNFLHGIKKSCAVLYPHLFQPLPWYADRKVEEMPEYVKFIQDEPYYQLDKGVVISWQELDEYIKSRSELELLSHPIILMGYAEPATKEEYEHYLKNQTT